MDIIDREDTMDRGITIPSQDIRHSRATLNLYMGGSSRALRVPRHHRRRARSSRTGQVLLPVNRKTTRTWQSRPSKAASTQQSHDAAWRESLPKSSTPHWKSIIPEYFQRSVEHHSASLPPARKVHTSKSLPSLRRSVTASFQYPAIDESAGAFSLPQRAFTTPTAMNTSAESRHEKPPRVTPIAFRYSNESYRQVPVSPTALDFLLSSPTCEHRDLMELQMHAPLEESVEDSILERMVPSCRILTITFGSPGTVATQEKHVEFVQPKRHLARLPSRPILKSTSTKAVSKPQKQAIEQQIHRWTPVFSKCERLETLTVKVQGHSEWHARTEVEDSLLALRVALERTRPPNLRSLRLSPSHPLSIWSLIWSGFGVLHEVCKEPSVWRKLESLEIYMRRPPANTHGSLMNTFHKVLYGYIQSFAHTLHLLRFVWVDGDGPSPLSVNHESGAEDFGKIHWPRLRELWLGNVLHAFRTIEETVRRSPNMECVKFLRRTHLYEDVATSKAWVEYMLPSNRRPVLQQATRDSVSNAVLEQKQPATALTDKPLPRWPSFVTVTPVGSDFDEDSHDTPRPLSSPGRIIQQSPVESTESLATLSTESSPSLVFPDRPVSMRTTTSLPTPTTVFDRFSDYERLLSPTTLSYHHPVSPEDCEHLPKIKRSFSDLILAATKRNMLLNGPEVAKLPEHALENPSIVPLPLDLQKVSDDEPINESLTIQRHDSGPLLEPTIYEPPRKARKDPPKHLRLVTSNFRGADEQPPIPLKHPSRASRGSLAAYNVPSLVTRHMHLPSARAIATAASSIYSQAHDSDFATPPPIPARNPLRWSQRDSVGSLCSLSESPSFSVTFSSRTSDVTELPAPTTTTQTAHPPWPTRTSSIAPTTTEPHLAETDIYSLIDEISAYQREMMRDRGERTKGSYVHSNKQVDRFRHRPPQAAPKLLQQVNAGLRDTGTIEKLLVPDEERHHKGESFMSSTSRELPFYLDFEPELRRMESDDG